MIENLDPKIAYLFLTIPFVVLWVIFIVVSRNTRREQLHASIIFALVGVFVENILYFGDYWKPESVWGVYIGSFAIFPEFILFGGSFAGIAAVVYQVVFRKETKRIITAGKTRRQLAVLTIFLLVTAFLSMSGVNSIYATAGGALAVTALISILRRDLFVPATLSGLLTAGIMFSFYSIGVHTVGNIEQLFKEIWLLYDTDLGFRLMGIPITELVWGFAVGSAVGVLYKFASGFKFLSDELN